MKKLFWNAVFGTPTPEGERKNLSVINPFPVKHLLLYSFFVVFLTVALLAASMPSYGKTLLLQEFESIFNLDLKEYLWDQADLFAEMPSEKKATFVDALTQILRDNGKMYSKHFPKSDTYRETDTVDDIKFLMRDYVRFLHNLDFKLFQAVPVYDGILSRFTTMRERWLKIDDGIMYTLYGMKTFAEQVDFYRDEILSQPWEPSEKYVKQLEEVKLRIQKLDENIARHDENIARHDENIARHDENIARNRDDIARLRAERETLLLVQQMIEAMSSVK